MRRLLILFSLLILAAVVCPIAHASYSYVGETKNTTNNFPGSSSSTTTSLTYSAHHLLALVVTMDAHSGGSSDVSSVSGIGTWTKIGTQHDWSTCCTTSVWWLGTSTSSGTTNVTVNFNTSSWNVEAFFEYNTGGDPVADGNCSALLSSGGSGTVTTCNTTGGLNRPDLLINICTGNSTAGTLGSGSFTVRDSSLVEGDLLTVKQFGQAMACTNTGTTGVALFGLAFDAGTPPTATTGDTFRHFSTGDFTNTSNIAFNGTSRDIMIAFWMKVSTWASSTSQGRGFMVSVADYDVNNPTWGIGNFSSVFGTSCTNVINAYYAQSAGSGASTYAASGVSLPSTGTWHHYATVIAPGTPRPTIWIDGVLQTTTNCSFNAPPPFNGFGTYNLRIGAGVDFNVLLEQQGDYAEVGVWDCSSSTCGNSGIAQRVVDTLYGGGTVDSAPMDGLIFYSPMWCADSTAVDLSGNLNNAALNGSGCSTTVPSINDFGAR